MLAYFDSLSGLIPCRIDLWVTPYRLFLGAPTAMNITFTASRGPFKRGEHYTTPASHVVPRSAVRRRCGQFHIRAHDWTKLYV